MITDNLALYNAIRISSKENLKQGEVNKIDIIAEFYSMFWNKLNDNDKASILELCIVFRNYNFQLFPNAVEQRLALDYLNEKVNSLGQALNLRPHNIKQIRNNLYSLMKNENYVFKKKFTSSLKGLWFNTDPNKIENKGTATGLVQSIPVREPQLNTDQIIQQATDTSRFFIDFKLILHEFNKLSASKKFEVANAILDKLNPPINILTRKKMLISDILYLYVTSSDIPNNNNDLNLCNLLQFIESLISDASVQARTYKNIAITVFSNRQNLSVEQHDNLAHMVATICNKQFFPLKSHGNQSICELLSALISKFDINKSIRLTDQIAIVDAIKGCKFNFDSQVLEALAHKFDVFATERAQETIIQLINEGKFTKYPSILPVLGSKLYVFTKEDYKGCIRMAIEHALSTNQSGTSLPRYDVPSSGHMHLGDSAGVRGFPPPPPYVEVE